MLLKSANIIIRDRPYPAGVYFEKTIAADKIKKATRGKLVGLKKLLNDP